MLSSFFCVFLSPVSSSSHSSSSYQCPDVFEQVVKIQIFSLISVGRLFKVLILPLPAAEFPFIDIYANLIMLLNSGTGGCVCVCVCVLMRKQVSGRLSNFPDIIYLVNRCLVQLLYMYDFNLPLKRTFKSLKIHWLLFPLTGQSTC